MTITTPCQDLLEEEGYLFVRGLIDRGTIGRLRSDIRQLLIQDGFVVGDPGLELKWSGKMPVSDELAPIGRIGRMISDLQSLAEVIHSQELLGFSVPCLTARYSVGWRTPTVCG